MNCNIGTNYPTYQPTMNKNFSCSQKPVKGANENLATEDTFTPSSDFEKNPGIYYGAAVGLTSLAASFVIPAGATLAAGIAGVGLLGGIIATAASSAKAV